MPYDELLDCYILVESEFKVVINRPFYYILQKSFCLVQKLLFLFNVGATNQLSLLSSNSQQDALPILHLFVVPQFFRLHRLNIYLIPHFMWTSCLAAHMFTETKKTDSFPQCTILLLVSSCILAFLLRLVLFAKYRTRKS